MLRLNANASEAGPAGPQVQTAAHQPITPAAAAPAASMVTIGQGEQREAMQADRAQTLVALEQPSARPGAAYVLSREHAREQERLELQRPVRPRWTDSDPASEWVQLDPPEAPATLKLKELMEGRDINPDPDLVTELIAANANLNARNERGLTMLMCAIRSGGSMEIIRLLINAGADITAQDPHGLTALTIAVHLDRLDCVKVLAELLTPEAINHPQSDGSTALMFAAHGGRTECVRTLASRLTADDINKAHPDGSTALMMAAWAGRTECVKILATLLATPAEINRARPSGATALMLAAQEGKAACVEVLVGLLTPEAINQSCLEGLTALMLAAMNDRADCVRLLVNPLMPAAINQATPDGLTALMLAAHKGFTNTVRVLVQALNHDPTSLNAVAQNGHTALTLASARGYAGTVALLLDTLATNDRAPDTRTAMGLITIRIAGNYALFGVRSAWLASPTLENRQELIRTFDAGFEESRFNRREHPEAPHIDLREFPE